MNFRDEVLDNNFRQAVRHFIRHHLPTDISWRVLHRTSYFADREDQDVWVSILSRNGWSVPRWPVEQGGTGWTPMQHHIFEEEAFAAGAPRTPMGISLIGPVICAVGTDEQKERHLPPIRKGEIAWCQGFSEPSAGSDLAALRTTAVRRGGEFIVNGQKIWTSVAHKADWGFFLVRTDVTVKPQKGISFLLIDMKSPGLTVRPILSIDGQHHLNEVFLDDVRVPVANLLGEQNRGWEYAKTLLGSERTASAEIYWLKRHFAKLQARCLDEDAANSNRAGLSGGGLHRNFHIRRELARLQIDLNALEYSVLRMLEGESNPRNAGALSSALKLRGADLMQRISELEVAVLGPASLRFFREAEEITTPGALVPDGKWPFQERAATSGYLLLRAATVFGGAKEVQKNIIAKLAFGL